MKKFAMLLWVIGLIACCQNSLAQGQVVEVPINTNNNNPLGYLVYLPENYDVKDDHPAILFLHGSGIGGNGSSSDLAKLYNNGIFKQITGGGTWPPLNENGLPPAEDFIVMAPQSPGWPTPVECNDMIDFLVNNYKVDPERVYLTGLSAGANAVWGSLYYFHDKIAAAVPIASNADWTADQACVFGETPIWAFHGSDDLITGTSQHIAAVDAVNACTPAFNPQAKITIYEGLAHSGWDQTYSLSGMDYTTDASYDPFDMSIYDWMLQFTTSNRGTGGNTNAHPVIILPNEESITLPQDTIVLDGSGSHDPDGTIDSIQWSLISAPSSINFSSTNTLTSTVTGLSISGTYNFSLQVWDNDGATSSASVEVTVFPEPNDAPIISISAVSSVQLPADSVLLDASSSNDPDGSISTISWSKISGPNNFTISDPEDLITWVTDLTPGSYEFELEISDNDGAAASGSVSVEVLAAANIPPVVEIARDSAITLPGNITLDGSSSYDPDGTIVDAQWSIVSAPSDNPVLSDPSALSTQVSGLIPGNYEFSLTVMDDDSSSSVGTTSVIVSPAPNQAPVASIVADSSITLPVNTILLDGSGSYDPDGTIDSVIWSISSGPSGDVVMSSADELVTEVENLMVGTYVFELTIFDDDNASATASIMLEVLPAVNLAPEAMIISDSSLVLPDNSLVLDGTLSSDPDGTIENVLWSLVSGPSTPILINSDSILSTAVGLIPGAYTFQLTITDNDGASNSSNWQVIVYPELANTAPVANAGADILVKLPQSSAVLDGTLSLDSDGDIVSSSWKLLSEPAPDTMTVSLDFNVPTADQVSGWNLITNHLYAGATWTNLTDSEGNTTDLSFTLLTNWTQFRQEGGATGNESGPFPDAVQDGIYWTKNGPEGIRVSGLEPGTHLEVSFFSGRSYNSDLTTVFTINGVSDSVDASFNTTQLVTFKDVVVGSTGNLDVQVSKGQTADYSYMNAMSLKIPVTAETEITHPDSLVAETFNLREGAYQFELTVEDNDGATTSDTVAVFVVDASTSQTLDEETGEISAYVWTNIMGQRINQLTGAINYPNNPDSSFTLDKFEAPINWNDNYGTQILGYLHPDLSGSYTFWISGDDNCELYLSSSEHEADKALIAHVPGWTISRLWTKYAEQRSVTITLEAGQKYYIEALHKEAGGGDNVAVAWEKPDGTFEVIPGDNLSPYAIPSARLGRTTALEKIKTEQLLIYPNPAAEYISVVVTEAAKISVRSISGQTLISTDAPYEGVFRLNLEGLTRGMYLINVETSQEVASSLFFKK